MLESPALAFVVFPVGVLYLLLHAGPMLRLWYEPSIRGGTAWRFFASEVALFAAWALCSPAVWNSPVGRVAVAVHVGSHLLFTLLDALAHDFLVGTALVPRGRSPLLWFAKEAGLVVDTLTHAVVVSARRPGDAAGRRGAALRARDGRLRLGHARLPPRLPPRRSGGLIAPRPAFARPDDPTTRSPPRNPPRGLPNALHI